MLQLRALGHDFGSLEVKQVMSGPPICVAPEDEPGAVQDLMNRRWVGHLVVTDATGRLAGIVTETDYTDGLDPLDLCGIPEILQKLVHSLREALVRLLADRRLDLREKGSAAGSSGCSTSPSSTSPVVGSRASRPCSAGARRSTARYRLRLVPLPAALQLRHPQVDGSFISALPRPSRNRAIVTSIVRLAEHLGFQLVAEGVVTPAELALLERMGCPIIQG